MYKAIKKTTRELNVGDTIYIYGTVIAKTIAPKPSSDGSKRYNIKFSNSCSYNFGEPAEFDVIVPETPTPSSASSA